MPNITFNISQAHLDRAIAALKAKFNFESSKLENETDGQFAKRMWANTLKQLVRQHEIERDEQAARDAAGGNIDIT